MTTPPDAAGPDDPTSRDELASAYLDAATSAEESATVERDVDLVARVDAFAGVRDRLAVEPQPAAQAEAHLAAALAAFDALPHSTEAGEVAPAPTDEPDASVTSLADRRRWTQRVPLGAVAAAVAVVALVAGAVRLADVGSDSADMATGAPGLESFDAAGDADGSGAAGTGQTASGGFGSDVALDAGDGADAPTAADDGATAPEPMQVGRPMFADVDSLAAYVRDRVAAGDTGSAEQWYRDGQPADTCDPVAVATPDRSTVRLADAATVDGEPVTYVVFTDDEGVDQLAVVLDERCDLVAQRPL